MPAHRSTLKKTWASKNAVCLRRPLDKKFANSQKLYAAPQYSRGKHASSWAQARVTVPSASKPHVHPRARLPSFRLSSEKSRKCVSYTADLAARNVSDAESLTNLAFRDDEALAVKQRVFFGSLQKSKKSVAETAAAHCNAQKPNSFVFRPRKRKLECVFRALKKTKGGNMTPVDTANSSSGRKYVFRALKKTKGGNMTPVDTANSSSGRKYVFRALKKTKGGNMALVETANNSSGQKRVLPTLKKAKGGQKLLPQRSSRRAGAYTLLLLPKKDVCPALRPPAVAPKRLDSAERVSPRILGSPFFAQSPIANYSKFVRKQYGTLYTRCIRARKTVRCGLSGGLELFRRPFSEQEWRRYLETDAKPRFVSCLGGGHLSTRTAKKPPVLAPLPVKLTRANKREVLLESVSRADTVPIRHDSVHEHCSLVHVLAEFDLEGRAGA
jgi:hypothetical protein